MKDQGITLLGAPVGFASFIRESLQQRINKVREITALLPNLKDPHTEYALLKSCLSLPKLMFSLRTVETTGLQDLLREFDRLTREALTRMLGSPVSDLQWEQAKLPVLMGGLGLRAAEDHAPAAYATSFIASQPLVRQLLGTQQEAATALSQELLDSLTTKQGEEATMASLQEQTQKIVSAVIDLSNKHLLSNRINEEAGEREIARLASLGLPHAGDWLNVPPIPALGLHLRPQEFISTVKYRLGVPVYDTEGPCPACLRPSDKFGDHALCCGHQGERIARHNHLRDALYDMAVAAALGPTKEGRFLLPGVDRRPADVFIPNWAGGRDAALDVTVVNPLQAATVARAATNPGSALTYAYDRKMRGAAELC